MALHAADFRSGDTEFGIFYPKDHLLAVFRGQVAADRAIAALRDAGFAAEDVVVATGPDVLEYSREMRADDGLFARFERFVSDLYGGEASLADEIVALAGSGHVFVAVYAPDGVVTARAREAMRPLAPVVLRKFDALTFTDL